MKKFLMIAALVGLVAGPASASILDQYNHQFQMAPVPGTVGDAIEIGGTPQYPTGPIGGRAVAYSENDPGHVYDNMPTDFGVGGPSTYTVAGYNFGSFAIDDVHLKAGTTFISSMHIIYYNPGAGPTHTLIVGIWSNPGGADAGLGATLAILTYTGLPTGFFLVPLGFGVATPTTDLWVGVAHLTPANNGFGTLLLGGSQPVSGAIGTGKDFQFSHTAGSVYNITGTIFNSTQATPARWIGNAHGNFYNLSYASAYYVGGNIHRAIGGIPEPTTIGLLGLGGFLVLRRRRA